MYVIPQSSFLCIFLLTPVETNLLIVFFLSTIGAYNNMTFRSPDQSGYQPQQAPITNTLNFDECCTTEINIELLCNDLQQQHYNVTISTDPGRYLCNYVYFSSMMELQPKTCVFVHVPRVELLPLPDQIRLITCLIKQLVVNHCNKA